MHATCPPPAPPPPPRTLGLSLYEIYIVGADARRVPSQIHFKKPCHLVRV